MSTDWIQTYTGQKFYPMTATGTIDIVDIAHALSMICRYTGHVNRFYSVAEHSVIMASYFVAMNCNLAARYALLHDASEAYLTDVPSPLKKMPEFAAYCEAEKRLQDIIYTAFGLDPEESENVTELDKAIIGWEAPALFATRDPDWVLPYCGASWWLERWFPRPGWKPVTANLMFLEMFGRLFPSEEEE